MQDNPSACIEDGSWGETVHVMKVEVSVNWSDYLGDDNVF